MNSPTFITSFDADVREVIASKLDFVADGGAFLYLRKGEANGALEVATYAVQLLKTTVPVSDAASIVDLLARVGLGAGVAAGGIAALNKAWEFGIKQLDKFLKNMDDTKEIYVRITDKLRKVPKEPDVEPEQSSARLVLPRDMRILCNRDAENEKALPILTALGARVRHRPDNVDSGTHRFHVNEKRFALHYKSPTARYVGVIGSDPFLRERLRADFLYEWDMYGPDIAE